MVVPDDQPCMCAVEKGDRKCKPTTRLTVMLPDIAGLGCWRLESHGFYAAVELSATAAMLEQATAQGQVFPARLRLEQRRKVEDGQTIRYAVPVIDIDVRLPEALAGLAGNGEQRALGTPLRSIDPGVSVADGLEAAARQAEPATRSRRAAEPIGAVADFTSPEPVPVPDDDLRVAQQEENKADAAQEKPLTKPQQSKLGVLVGRLRDEHNAITTEQLWAAVAKMRQFPVDEMVELLGGKDADGVLHFGPLLADLRRTEASQLIDRLEKLEPAGAAA
jgi:hypothetical protein